VNLLNKYSKKYKFTLVYLPRKRLDLLKNKKIVLWSNPLWVKDKSETIYLWSKNIVRDSDVFISLKEKSFEYKNTSSLNGKRVACVAGYYYPGIDQVFSSGNATRLDVKAEEQILSMVLSKREELGIMSLSTIMYHFSRSVKTKSLIAHSEDSKTSYYRRFSSTKDYRTEFSEVLKVIENSSFRKEYSIELESYFLKLAN
jgi:polar amino acid transport system substrate-binding protein